MNTNATDIYYRMMLDTLENGGGTYERDAFRHAKLPYRYVVALGQPYARQIPAALGAAAGPGVVKALRDLSDERGVWTPQRALGTWVSEGKVYIDIVESFPSEEDALYVARERGELAIWDSVDNVEITV